MIPRLLALLAMGVAPAAVAQEYREFDLVDGRTVIAEVVDTDTTGFVLRLPQGDLHLPFANMADMRVSDADAFTSAPPWPVVVVASADHRAGFVAAFRTVPRIALVGDDPGAAPAATVEALAACGPDAACARATVEPGTWVIDARMDGAEARFTSSLVGTNVVIDVVADRTRPVDVARAAHTALGLRPPDDLPAITDAGAVAAARPADGAGPTDGAGPADGAGPRSETTSDDGAVAGLGTRSGDHPVSPPPPIHRRWTRQRVLRASFVPIPGYPSFAQGDTAGGALALAAVVPTTVLWIGATGKTAQSAPEHLLLAAGGYYVSTVLANQILGTRALPDTVSVGVAPVPEGGAVLSVVATR